MGTKTEPKKLMAKAWEIITCPSNHPCYMLVSDVWTGSKASGMHTSPLNECERLHPGTLPSHIKCPTCKEPVFQALDGTINFYVRGELRGIHGKYLEEATANTAGTTKADV